ncbi:MAG TPA: hypothetical protein VN969_14175 [Streptosporangiaceae bacterium]|nr:hypothetical protein [Streptosporangiaceae bacterium]
MKSTAVTLNMLAVPALAAAAGLHHPGAIAYPAAPAAATPATATLTAAIDSSEATCQAWEPLLPGLLYLATAPVLTLGGVPLIGGGTCEPTGKGYDISLGVNVAIPPGSACTSLPLIRVNLGLAIGVPDENGVDPCKAPAAPAPVLRAPVPRAPVPPVPVPPVPVPPVPAIAPRPAAPSSPALAPPPPARPPARPSAPALAPPPPAPSSPVLASPPPHRRPTPPPATTPAPALTTPAAALPPPPAPRPPAPRPPAQPAPPVQAAAVVAPAAVKHAHKPLPRKQAPKPVHSFFQAAPEQPPAPAFKPGQPVLPVGVLVTVVMTPCVATVAARLGKIMMGHAA